MKRLLPTILLISCQLVAIDASANPFSKLKSVLSKVNPLHLLHHKKKPQPVATPDVTSEQPTVPPEQNPEQAAPVAANPGQPLPPPPPPPGAVPPPPPPPVAASVSPIQPESDGVEYTLKFDPKGEPVWEPEKATAESIRAYVGANLRLLLKQADEQGADYLDKEELPEAYLSFLVGAMTVPFHESGLNHFRRIYNTVSPKTGQPRCSEKMNSGTAHQTYDESRAAKRLPNRHLYDTFEQYLGMKDAPDAPVQDCGAYDPKEPLLQLIGSSDLLSTGCGQISMISNRAYMDSRDFLSVEGCYSETYKMYMAGFKTLIDERTDAEKYPCMQREDGSVDYARIIHGAWSGKYNGGSTSHACRFMAIPANLPKDEQELVKNDDEKKSKLIKLLGEKYHIPASDAGWAPGNDAPFEAHIASVLNDKNGFYATHLAGKDLDTYRTILRAFDAANAPVADHAALMESAQAVRAEIQRLVAANEASDGNPSAGAPTGGAPAAPAKVPPKPYKVPAGPVCSGKPGIDYLYVRRGNTAYAGPSAASNDLIGIPEADDQTCVERVMGGFKGPDENGKTVEWAQILPPEEFMDALLDDCAGFDAKQEDMSDPENQRKAVLCQTSTQYYFPMTALATSPKVMAKVSVRSDLKGSANVRSNHATSAPVKAWVKAGERLEVFGFVNTLSATGVPIPAAQRSATTGWYRLDEAGTRWIFSSNLDIRTLDKYKNFKPTVPTGK